MKHLPLKHLWITVFFALLPCSAFAQLSSGLLNYWDFEGDFNDDAGTVAGASSTVNDHGTTPAGGVTLTAGGPLGQYANFAGAGNYVNIPNSADVIMAGRSLTISAWFRVPAFTRSWQALIAHGEGSDYRIARRGTDAVMAYAGGTGDIPGSAIGPAVNNNLWHHIVAITEHGVSTRLWVNGNLIATGGVPTLTNNGAAQLMIGGNPNDAGGAYRSWNGDIDDVAMWSRALTPAEITAIYSGGLAGNQLSTLLIPADTDGDGLPNLWETQYGLDPNDNGLNPNNNGVPGNPNNGAAGDPDNDGLPNALELNPHRTNPVVADTDGDGLTDGAEVNTHQTSPTLADTDADGLSDGAEITTHQTNPLLFDSDNDGVTDSAELARGTNPIIANTGYDFGLAAYWPMDADYNSSVGGVTATSMGANPIPLVPGKFGNAVQLDGNDQFLQVDGDENNFDFVGQSVTVSAWFTADTIDRDWQALIGKGDGSNNWRLHRRGADQPPEMSFCGGSADIPKHSVPLNVGTGFYHHVAAVSQRGVGVRLYMDGVLVSSGPAPDLQDSTNPLRIGDNAGAPGRFWEGKIDDLAIWCRPLSEVEIAQIYNGGVGTSLDNLVGPQAPFDFTAIVYDKLANTWTLTWNSKPGRTYRLNYSTDLLDFGNDVDDSIPSGGSSTTYGPFPNPVPLSGSRVYFMVSEN